MNFSISWPAARSWSISKRNWRGWAASPRNKQSKHRNSKMAVRLGINPIGWTNDCMHWLGGSIPLDTCLSQTRAAGFSGTELGRKFPRTVAALRPILKKHNLALVSGWYSGEILRRDWKAEFKAMKPHFDLLKGLGCNVLIYAETVGNIINDVGACASTRPHVGGAAEWRRYCGELSALADEMV